MPLIVAIVGATGTGKTDLSLDLAERFRDRRATAEIVNADAMQLYRGMDIGTAKLPPDEWRGIPHHLFDVLDVTDEATVAALPARWRARRSTAILQPRGACRSSSAAPGSTSRASSTTSGSPAPTRHLRAALEAELDGARARDAVPAAGRAGPGGRRERSARATAAGSCARSRSIELTGEPVSGIPARRAGAVAARRPSSGCRRRARS